MTGHDYGEAVLPEFEGSLEKAEEADGFVDLHDGDEALDDFYAPPAPRDEGAGVLASDPTPSVAEPAGPSAASIVTAALERIFTEDAGWNPGGERPHTWASQRKECARAMALDLLFPEDAGEVGPDRCARMTYGKEFEVLFRSRLERAGLRADPPFEVVGAQDHFKLRHRRNADRVVLTGKVDGKVRFGHDQPIPFEIKRGASFARCRTVDDLLAGRWSAASVYQILAYLLGLDLPVGLLVIDSGGVPMLIPIRLEDHLEKAEAFYATAEVASECKHDGRELPGFAENPELCHGCDHRGKSCAPPWFSAEGPWVSQNPGLIETVETCLRTKDAAREYSRGWERLKTLCRGKELVMIGPHTIKGKTCGNGWKLNIEGKLPKSTDMGTDLPECASRQAEAETPAVEEDGLAFGAWPEAVHEIAEAKRWAAHGVIIEPLETPVRLPERNDCAIKLWGCENCASRMSTGGNFREYRCENCGAVMGPYEQIVDISGALPREPHPSSPISTATLREPHLKLPEKDRSS